MLVNPEFLGRIAAWNGGSWQALGSGVNNRVHTLTTSAGALFAGGAFSAAGGKATGSLAVYGPLTTLTLSGSGPATAQTGTPLAYTVTLANAGPGNAVSTRITLTFASLVPSSVTPSQGTCAGAAPVVCDIGAVAAGGTATVQIAATGTAAGTGGVSAVGDALAVLSGGLPSVTLQTTLTAPPTPTSTPTSGPALTATPTPTATRGPGHATQQFIGLVARNAGLDD
jgi:hypothetical protein